MNKNNHHIYKAEQIDWEKLESVGISRSQIEKDGNLDLLLQGEETNVMSIKIKTPVFSLTMKGRKYGPAPSGRGNQCHVH